MVSIWHIAMRDIRAFFNSPRAGAIFWFFLIFVGYFFQYFINLYLQMVERAPMTGGQAPQLEELMRALFQNCNFILLLIIPAITMATFSEEKKNQTLRLLQTSPVTSWQIVLGKFLASMGLMFLVLFASCVYPMFLVKYGTIDVGPLVTGYLGLFLLMAAQIAFGVWISSMTQNQFMAFLLTMLGLFFLMILNVATPNIASGGGLEEAFKYIAYGGHLESFYKGLITVKDTVYFILFISLFLFFTNVVLDSQRWR